MTQPETRIGHRRAEDLRLTSNAKPDPQTRDQRSKNGKRKRAGNRRPWWWRFIKLALLVYVAAALGLAAMENRLVYPGAYREGNHFVRNANAATGEATPKLIEAKSIEPSSIEAGEAVGIDPKRDRGSIRPGTVQTVRYGGGGDPDVSTDDLLPGRLRVLPRKPRDRWVIFFHGNDVRAIDLNLWIARLGENFKANVFAAEYRGFTDDRPVSQSGVIADGIAAVQYVHDTFDVEPSRMIFWGRSLGGGVAAAAAVHDPPALLVMDRTFDSAVNVAKQRFWFLPIELLMKNRFDSAARLSNYGHPVIVVHGDRDRIVPNAAGRRLFDRLATSRRRWIEMPDTGHLDPMPDSTLRDIADQDAVWSRRETMPPPD